jgi:seipin
MPSQAQVSEVSQLVGKGVAKLAAASFLVFWLSATLYGVFYYTYMPKISFEVPAHLQYDPECSGGKKSCVYPTASFGLQHPRTGEDFFRVGQDYELVLQLEMPESQVNQDVGLFMAELSLNNQKMAAVTTVQRSTSLKYKSCLLKTLETLIFVPLYLTGHKTEVQTITVPMGAFSPSPSNIVTRGIVTLKSRDVAAYSAKFISHAKFEGIRYWLFYYPITVSVLATLSIFAFFMVFFVLGSFVKDMTSSIRASRSRAAIVIPPTIEEAEEEKEEEEEQKEDNEETSEQVVTLGADEVEAADEDLAQVEEESLPEASPETSPTRRTRCDSVDFMVINEGDE